MPFTRKLFTALFTSCLAALAATGQDYHWLLGNWPGTGTVPGSSYATRFVYNFSIDYINRNEFRGTVREEVPDGLGTRKDVSISGLVVENTLVVAMGRITYIKQPPKVYWADCSGCQVKCQLQRNGDSLRIVMQTVNCGPSCNGTSVFSRRLSSMDSVSRENVLKLVSAQTAYPEPAATAATPLSDIDKTAAAVADTAAHQLARATKTIATYTTKEKEIRLELFDNGEIDGDTVTVYHNKQLIVDRKALGLTPIVVTIPVDANDRVHEFVLVANNLGRIPPNTALLRIRAGKQQYELYPSTNLSQNASVIFIYSGD